MECHRTTRVLKARQQQVTSAVDLAVEWAKVRTVRAKRGDFASVRDKLAGKERRGVVQRKNSCMIKSNFHKRIVSQEKQTNPEEKATNPTKLWFLLEGLGDTM